MSFSALNGLFDYLYCQQTYLYFINDVEFGLNSSWYKKASHLGYTELISGVIHFSKVKRTHNNNKY